MNMPPPVSYKSYLACKSILHEAYKLSAEESMLDAANEVKLSRNPNFKNNDIL